MAFGPHGAVRLEGKRWWWVLLRELRELSVLVHLGDIQKPRLTGIGVSEKATAQAFHRDIRGFER